ncbi:MAG: D-glycerate dehydrogenase [Candidatus Uhrbacteria bacterium]|nr:D-glycerate dehydrogenase [Candidatus Uhrbacteria bacterium]
MANVFITRKVPEAGLKLLRAKGDITIDLYDQDKIIPRNDLLRGVKGADVLVSILTDKIDAEVMDAAGPSLKLIANYAVGFDNIDLEAAQARHIAVCNAPTPEISESVAEHTIALIFALAHRIVEADAFARSGKYEGWGPELLLGGDVAGKTLGIIGTGAIGSALAKRFHLGFGVKVLYHDIKRNEKLEAETHAAFVENDQLLQQSDYVSVHVPLLPTTKHLISDREFSLMKPSAFLINTSRGPIVDTHALVKALKQKKIAGAGIDVFECEPAFACDPEDAKALRSFSNVVITPHTASATVETRDAMSRQVALNVLAFIDGKTPPNIIRPQVTITSGATG